MNIKLAFLLSCIVVIADCQFGSNFGAANNYQQSQPGFSSGNDQSILTFPGFFLHNLQKERFPPQGSSQYTQRPETVVKNPNTQQNPSNSYNRDQGKPSSINQNNGVLGNRPQNEYPRPQNEYPRPQNEYPRPQNEYPRQPNQNYENNQQNLPQAGQSTVNGQKQQYSQNQQYGQSSKQQEREPERKFENYDPITEFSWNLFKNTNNPQEPNSVICPLSPQYLLSYLAKGAVGQTKSEIVNAIKYQGPSQLNSLTRTLLADNRQRELQLASALFISERLRINPEFQQSLDGSVEVIQTDFSNQEKFNRAYRDWVSAKTKGVLSNVQYKPNQSTKMIMTSAVYFKGEWIFRLNPGGTQNFYVNRDTPVQVRMMSLVKKLPYAKIEGLGEWIALPYNSNDSMVIFLPHKDVPLDTAIERLNIQDIFNSMNNDNYGNITLTLPRFKVESKRSLIEPLKRMGITSLFSSHADLPNLIQSKEPVAVSQMLQQASLEVNEEGSIATSLTAIGVVALSFSPPTPDVEFNVNRPFIAMIIERKLNFPYFIAKITNPSL